MRNLPEERLKRRQSDRRKELIQRVLLWSFILLAVSWGVAELFLTLIKR